MHMTLYQTMESAFYLWINGKFVGYSEDSRLPAHFDISKFLKKGKNRLAMKVFRFSDGSYLEDQDYWKYSGIERNVFIQARPKSRMNDYVLGNSLVNNYKDGNFSLDVSMLPPKSRRNTHDLRLRSRPHQGRTSHHGRR